MKKPLNKSLVFSWETWPILCILVKFVFTVMFLKLLSVLKPFERIISCLSCVYFSPNYIELMGRKFECFFPYWLLSSAWRRRVLWNCRCKKPFKKKTGRSPQTIEIVLHPRSILPVHGVVGKKREHRKHSARLMAVNNVQLGWLVFAEFPQKIK